MLMIVDTSYCLVTFFAYSAYFLAYFYLLAAIRSLALFLSISILF